MGANTNTMPGTAMPRPPVGGTGGFGNPSNPGQPISAVMSSGPPPGYGGYGPAINNMSGGPTPSAPSFAGFPTQQSGGCPTCGR
jgi:hypothetical protein